VLQINEDNRAVIKPMYEDAVTGNASELKKEVAFTNQTKDW